jgi:arylsulfatase A-like enzyme
VTFAEVLKEAGYATAICGKWHLGDRADSTDTPHHHGFDYAYCIGYPYPEGGREHWPSHVFVNGRQTAIPENTGGRNGRYMDDLYTEAAIEFIRHQRGGPFVVFLSLQGPHAPIDANISPRYAGRDWPDVEKRFASMLERTDENVGRLTGALRELALDGQTLVLFSSDNGPHLEGGHDAQFFRSSGGLRGAKRDLYEGGIRVPLIARWAGVVRPGSTSAHLSGGWDLLPTMVELAGAPAPAGIDGISFAPTLRGMTQRAHEFLYWETRERGGSQAVRWGDWKVVRRGLLQTPDAPLELYDLPRDPAEGSDVAARHPDIVTRMREMMVRSHVPAPEAPLFHGQRAASARAAR